MFLYWYFRLLLILNLNKFLLSEIFLKGITVDEFLKLIFQRMETNLGGMQRPPIETFKQTYLSRKEVCQMLKISLPTLNEWSKQGILQAYKKGNRVLYKATEIDDSVNQGAFKKGKRIGK